MVVLAPNPRSERTSVVCRHGVCMAAKNKGETRTITDGFIKGRPCIPRGEKIKPPNLPPLHPPVQRVASFQTDPSAAHHVVSASRLHCVCCSHADWHVLRVCFCQCRGAVSSSVCSPRYSSLSSLSAVQLGSHAIKGMPRSSPSPSSSSTATVAMHTHLG